jgi:hypothetical protein
MSRGGARDGAGAPRQDNALRRSQVSVGLTPELEQYARQEAARTGKSKVAVLRELMLKGLKK